MGYTGLLVGQNLLGSHVAGESYIIRDRSWLSEAWHLAETLHAHLYDVHRLDCCFLLLNGVDGDDCR